MMQEMKLIVNNQKVPVRIEKEGDRLFIYSAYHSGLIAEIKCMSGRKWHGYDAKPRKVWSIADNQRNHFQLSFLKGENPYAPYEIPLVEFTPNRSCMYQHQRLLVRSGLTHHYDLWAAEMGCGKTLAAIELMEKAAEMMFGQWWWIGPKSALTSVKIDFRKWKTAITPEFMTYEGLVKRVKNWTPGMKPPMGIVFDESSKMKNWTAQRTQAGYHVACAIRETWGNMGWVILMSGSPAPGSPQDWWSQCEVACPGYIKEGETNSFVERLAVTKTIDTMGMGTFKKIVCWKDSPLRCNSCGENEEHIDHNVEQAENNTYFHHFIACKNEVAFLYERMKGLVTVLFKKDCLKELPDKIYKKVICPVKPATLNAARLIKAGAKSAAACLIALRELSDGFQYAEKLVETVVCECDKNPECLNCGGTGKWKIYERETIQVPCPKDDALIDIMDELDDVGRLVVYGGFTGTIDRLEALCQKLQWETIRVDGRGWKFSSPFVNNAEEAIERFQNKSVQDRIVFIGHPGSAGMGLTLTASPIICYYSNDFNGESRIQSEDRIHRPGMDLNIGATIIDLIHLPTDVKILDNVNKKRDLQSITMGDIDLDLKLEAA